VLTDGGFWLVQILNSLQLAMLLFLLSVGLTVIFGLLNFVNLAHGSLYALGALCSYSIVQLTGSMWWAYVLAPIAVALVGALLYITIIDRMRAAGPLRQVLVTFGLLFMLTDAQRFIWGTDQLGVSGTPFAHSLSIAGQTYPAYRLFIIAVGLVVFVALHLLLEYTRLGREVRAAVDDAETASCMGVNVQRTFFMVFLVGCALAGLAGAVALPAFSAEAGMGVAILVPTLVIVVVGGLGSFKGAFVGSLLIGTTLTFGQVWFPQFAGVLMYALLVVVLLFKPAGLLPARSAAGS
jgi:branched-chain amino acid transport system permease protein